MTEPRRLLDDPSQLSDDELRILTRELRVEPPSGLEADVWAGLAARLPLAPAASPAPLGRLAVLSKITFVVLAIVGAGMLARSALRSEPARVFTPPIAVSAPASASVAVPELAVPVAPAMPDPVREPSAPPRKRTHAVASATPPIAAPTSNAQEESRLIAAARSALRAGDSARALSLLGEAEQRFAHGVLGQEREALTIEALAKSGQHARAKSRGEAFLKAYRDSPYAARIRTLIGS